MSDSSDDMEVYSGFCDECYDEDEFEDDDVIDHEIGLRLIQFLRLKVKPNGRVNTEWGDKTPMGLARSVRRINDDVADADDGDAATG